MIQGAFIMKHTKFITFLESLTTEDTKVLMESVEKAFKLCFEGSEEIFEEDKYKTDAQRDLDLREKAESIIKDAIAQGFPMDTIMKHYSDNEKPELVAFMKEALGKAKGSLNESESEVGVPVDSFEQDKADMLPAIRKAVETGTIVDDIKQFIEMKDYKMAKYMKEEALKMLRAKAGNDSK